MLRFQLDENVSPAIAVGLRARGVDVSTAHETGRDGISDPDLLALSDAEDRVLFTHDHDFVILHAQGVPHAGIAYCRQRTRTAREIIWYLALMSECLEPSDVRQRVEFV